MKIVSWNVNSIKARKDHVKEFLKTRQPDILMIQELKGVEFPADEFEEMGYQSKAVTQKAYNGVAILSKHDIKTINTALPGDTDDEQARYIEADINGLRVINIYLPNGNPIGTEKFDYKLAWMERLKKQLKKLRDKQIDFVIGGDFNVIPEALDCYNPKAWEKDALFQPESRKALRSLEYLGLYDAFRIYNNQAENYTFWDYQAGAWNKNNGIRIDHFLLPPALVDRMQDCTIDTEPRGWDKPSDHTPIVLELSSV